MDRWLLSFISGAILSLFSPIVPVLFYQLLLFSLIFLFIGLNRYRSITSFLIGFFWVLSHSANYHNTWQYNQLTSAQVFNSSIAIEGKVVDIPDVKNNTTRFIFRVESLNRQNVKQPFLVRLRWDDHKEEITQGQHWQLSIRMKPAHGYANPAGFSYQTWLISQNIVATGYVVKSIPPTLIYSSAEFRTQLYQQFLTVLKHNNLLEQPLTPLILALTFAEKSQFNPDLWQVIQATGTQHLFAISGLHLGLVAIFSFYSVLFFFRMLPIRLLPSLWQVNIMRFNSRKIALIVSVFISLFYAYLADFSVPTIRAMIMLSLFVVAKLVSIQLSVIRWMLMSISLMIVLTPFSLLTASFWLSCYAVVVIFFIVWRFQALFNAKSASFLGHSLAVNQPGIIQHYCQRVWHYFKTLAILQIWLVLLLLPITVLFFQQWSVVAIVANLIALPIASFIIIPLCLLAVMFVYISPFFSAWLVKWILVIFSGLWHLLSLLAEFPWAIQPVSMNQAIWFSVLCAILLLFLWLPPVGRLTRFTKRYTGILVLVSFVSYQTFTVNNSDENWQVNVLDVGHGLAVVIIKNGRAILYDTGASYPSGFNLADSVILPFLQNQGITQLDYVFVSHNDNDHAGAIEPLLNGVQVTHLVINNINIEKKAIQIQPHLNVSACLSGATWQWQLLRFRVLSPNSYAGDKNDDSCVLHISDGKHQVLLPGDISHSVETALVDFYPELKADVVIAPHHGSKTSSSDAFIKWLQPEVVVFSTAFMNRWKMPNVAVLQRYSQENVVMYNTASHGMVKINIDKRKMDVAQYRHDLWPFWFAN